MIHSSPKFRKTRFSCNWILVPLFHEVLSYIIKAVVACCSSSCSLFLFILPLELPLQERSVKPLSLVFNFYDDKRTSTYHPWFFHPLRPCATTSFSITRKHSDKVLSKYNVLHILNTHIWRTLRKCHDTWSHTCPFTANNHRIKIIFCEQEFRLDVLFIIHYKHFLFLSTCTQEFETRYSHILWPCLIGRRSDFDTPIGWSRFSLQVWSIRVVVSGWFPKKNIRPDFEMIKFQPLTWSSNLHAL